jgi:hypothetical protein
MLNTIIVILVIVIMTVVVDIISIVAVWLTQHNLLNCVNQFNIF